LVALGAGLLAAGVLSACSSGSSTATGASSGHVLLVGTFHGHKGGFTTIQSAVNAAKSGDWILVAPGDYKEDADLTSTPASVDHGHFGGVLIQTSNLHIRGMNRNTTVVDGTKQGAPECSTNQADQQFGVVQNGQAIGRNGIVVYKANHVSIDNLTACNYLSGSQDSGNEIWWNGGADTATIGLHGYEGSYLTAETTYFGGESTAAEYGIFSSDSAGDGASWSNIYASNFNDSGMYVGACQQVCDVTISKAWMEYNALGYSGTNSGGAVVIKDSLFDNNQDGLDTNTQINGDPPAPQNGDCPGNAISPITHTRSCWVAMDNTFEDNNNPNAPEAGNAAAGPTGTVMTLSGGRNDTVMHNTFKDNGAWGILFIPYPDSSTPEYNQSCTGTGGVEVTGFGCVYDPMNDRLADNTFDNNGYFKNPSNADYGQIALNPNQPSNCFMGNVAPNGSVPSDLETKYPTCGLNRAAADVPSDLLAQTLCDTGFGSCPAGANYPVRTTVVLHPVPKSLPTMPNPCVNVPDNAWCSGGKPVS
jgi:hypothetical protein